MDLIELGTKILSQNMGGQADNNAIAGALSSLLGDGQGGVDLSALAAKMASSGELGNVLNSWLGDGANSAISPQSIMELFGEGQLAEFASALGANSEDAAGSLADALPQMVDNASSGGSLLDAFGGAGGLLNAAKSILS